MDFPLYPSLKGRVVLITGGIGAAHVGQGAKGHAPECLTIDRRDIAATDRLILGARI